jgi:hypothetical protein
MVLLTLKFCFLRLLSNSSGDILHLTPRRKLWSPYREYFLSDITDKYFFPPERIWDHSNLTEKLKQYLQYGLDSNSTVSTSK